MIPNRATYRQLNGHLQAEFSSPYKILSVLHVCFLQTSLSTSRGQSLSVQSVVSFAEQWHLLRRAQSCPPSGQFKNTFLRNLHPLGNQNFIK
uniref:Uncharacterized protein n=1 Tax=Pyxicephalus adspersus TaxID=30357 RepID=A0AAV3A7W7_PYXAD|nr:TPA: hypothetical protein GDO54_015170 [Pyxicephalus adspersus]